MNQQEFQSQVERLKQVYGDRAYPDERVRLLWRDVNNLSGQWFEGAVDQLISQSRQAPLAAEFGPLIGLERERQAKIDKDRDFTRGELTKYSCEYCMDRGVYLCVQNGDRTKPYAFRCHCGRGHADQRRGIPQYKQAHADQEFRFYQIGREA